MLGTRVMPRMIMGSLTAFRLSVLSPATKNLSSTAEVVSVDAANVEFVTLIVPALFTVCRLIFAPESRWGEIGTPDLVLAFADADQISALVAMLGSHNGRAINTIAPFGAACHSIVFAAAQMEEEEPMAVMGLFDISQRSKAIARYLSLTLPYPLWAQLATDLDKSCLTTHAWKEIEKRL